MALLVFLSGGPQTRLLDREDEDDIRDCDSMGMTERGSEVFVDEMSFKLMTDDGE